MVGRFTSSFPFPIVSFWGLMIATSIVSVCRYEGTPNLNATPPDTLPAIAKSLHQESTSSVFVFVHPRCPCSNATINELERVISQAGDRLRTSVIFWHPKETGVNWHESQLWKRTKSIPGIRVIDDIDCVLTQEFRVSTSGQVLLYDQNGQLKFSGGITQARGHSGDNLGADVILSCVTPEVTRSGIPPRCSNVFGCPLIERRASHSEEGARQ